MKTVFTLLIVLSFIASSLAETTMIDRVEIGSRPQKIFETHVDLDRYKKFFSSDSGPNLNISPERAYDLLVRGWEKRFGGEPNENIFIFVKAHFVNLTERLWFYSISASGMNKDNNSIQCNVCVMPNGDVVFPRRIK
jgi:hypothetical protein